MKDIPDDFMAAATAALNDMPVGLMNWNEARRATARAIAAERERCAEIADARKKAADKIGERLY